MARGKSKSNSIIPWRFGLFFGLLAVVGALTLTRFEASRSLLIAFDVAALVFLASHWPTFAYDAKRMRAAAAANDANRVVLLIISFLLSVVILAAIVGELSQGHLSALDKVLVAVSLVFVWTFGNAVYTLHYAHLFYTSDDGGKDLAGLEFPKLREPLMADFVYFAFTLGVAVQTSDVAVTSPHIRKVVTAHCVAGFFFNLGVLALTINILGSR
jgi:uncharacterized membrane protein